MKTDADPSALAGRIAIAKGEASGLAFAKKCGFSASLLAKYLEGSTPGVDKIVAIADAAGVTVEWLATGKGPMRPGEDAAPAATSSPADAGRPSVDVALFGRVQAGVADAYKTGNARIYPGPLGEEAARIYNDLVATYDDPAERLEGLRVLLERLRRDLRTTPEAGEKGGSRAS